MTITSVSVNTGQLVVFNNKTSSYTLTANDSSTDDSRVLILTSASAATVTIPIYATSGIPVGAKIVVVQYGAGQLTIAGDTGVTVYGTPGLKTRAQYSRAVLLQVSTNTWLLYGDISA
jgi:hypothetical protein